MSDAPKPLGYASPTQPPLTGWGTVRWWEYRRLIYNGTLLMLGMIVLALIALIGSISGQNFLDFGSPLNLLFGILFYGFCANVCYTGGLILDLAWKEPNSAAATRRRRGIFIAGLIFSCLVTTVPLWLTIVAAAFQHLQPG